MVKLDALAFGAHPDDVELSCGGTLIQLADAGYKTGVVALTAGELGTRGNPSVRAREFAAAAAILKAESHTTLDVPDGDVCSNRDNKLKVIREIRHHQPSIVFAPYWIDRHPDHAHASILIREAAFLSGLKKIETGQPAHRPYKLIYYPSRVEFRPTFIVDISESQERKMQAIQAYQSQFHNPSKDAFGAEETNISGARFLEAVVARARQYGAFVGVAYGEAFLVREPLRLSDPVRFFGPETLDAFL